MASSSEAKSGGDRGVQDCRENGAASLMAALMQRDRPAPVTPVGARPRCSCAGWWLSA